MPAAAISVLAVALGVVVLRDSSGPVVAIAENQAKVVTLSDGSRLNMRPGSELSFFRVADDRCIQLVRGDVVVNAAKQETGHHLCVQTKDFIVTVVGTIFSVRVEEKGSSVSVQEGTVWVQQGSTRKTLAAGAVFSTIAAEPAPALAAAPPAQAPPQAREPAKPSAMSFDSISIRKPPPDQIGKLSGDRITFGGVRLTDVTLKELVLMAYDMQVFQVSGGPPWIDKDRFNVETRVGTDVKIESPEPLFLMMQDMLATRFKLKVRRTIEQAAAYALVLNGKDSKLQASSEPEGFDVSGPSLIGAATMAHLAQFVSKTLGQPVVDRTGLPGIYNIELHFLPEATREALVARGNVPGGGGRGDGGRGGGVSFLDEPDLRTALREQLGLKLETAKAPVEFLVIESVEHPSDN
jgi:uncharacterized protein (TIGR03435 family)